MTQALWLALIVALLVPQQGTTPLLSSVALTDFWRNYTDVQKKTMTALAAKVGKNISDRDLIQAEENERKAEANGEIRLAAGLSYFLTQIYYNQDRMDQALAAATRGRQLAWRADDALIAGLCGYGIVRVYFRIGNFELAEVAGHAALVDAQKARFRTAETRALLAAIDSHLGRRNLSRMQFRLALEEARRLKDSRLLANLEDYFAAQLLNWGNIEEAAAAAERSYQIRQKINVDLAWSYLSLAKIRLASKQPEEALRLLDKVIAKRPAGLMPNWVYYYRAQALLALRKEDQALDALRLATNWTARLRLFRPFGDALQTSGEVQDQQIYSLYVEALAERSIREGTPELAAESFEAGQANRAVSLRNRRKAGVGWQNRLPGDYWEKLSDLRRAELALGPNDATSNEVAALRAAVTEIESRAGLQEEPTQVDPLRLHAVQQRLAERELLAAFHLGERSGVLWLVDRSSIRVLRLPSAPQIKRLADEFRANLEGGGTALYRTLFPSEQTLDAYNSLVVIPDDILFEVPFAALRSPGGRHLIETHAVRLAPTANIEVVRRGEASPDGLAGIADPVCNLADTRYRGPKDAKIAFQLPRLAGSAAEVDRAGALFGNAFRKLTGTDITGEGLRKLLQSSPQVLHFSTHVYQPEGSGQSPVLTLGLNREGEMMVLNAAEISTLGAAPPLVTLSGCGSGRGPLAPGSGLLGLTRAWLMAGSRAVVASLWPVVDDSGELFQDYYRFLLGSKGTITSRLSAQAIQNAQVSMLRKGDWRAKVEYWAAYFVIGAI